jgi:FtsZ-interacting cell division protein ZipA
MPELRVTLIGLGLLFLAGLALWEWRRSKRRHMPHLRVDPPTIIDHSTRVDHGTRPRRDPMMDGMSGLSAADPREVLDVPTIHPVEPVMVGVAAESAVDVPSAARFDLSEVLQPAAPVAIQWPPQNAARVLSLRVVNARGEQLSGRSLRIALEAAGLRHGPQMIYHLVTNEGAVLASVANLVRPGNLDPALIDAQEFRGVSLFSVLPGALPPERMLEGLVMLARALAQRLGGVVQDAQGNDLDGVRLGQLQQSLADEAP